jgi:prepilin-type N-terminal cleavage/methylation domain-containing protein
MVPTRHSLPFDRRSFTLIELLIVIAVVAILSVVVVLVLNPTELLKQARDSNRIADMDTLNKAVTLYLGDRGGSLGTASTTYFSLIDPAATSTGGTNCASLGLVAPMSWNYHCAASSTARKLDGTGWIPLNFSSITFSPPFGALPLDPTNTSSSGLFYMYVPGTTTYAIAATLQSEKYLASKGNGDGGLDPSRLETGSNLRLIAAAEGLVGWWTFDEGSGSAAADSSGNGNAGSLTCTGGGCANPTWTTGKVGNALSFTGTAGAAGPGSYVSVASIPTTSHMTMMAWIRPTTAANDQMFMSSVANNANYMRTLSGKAFSSVSVSGGPAQSTIAGATTLANSTWYHVAGSFNGTAQTVFLNGTQDGTTNATTTSANLNWPAGAFNIGIYLTGSVNPFVGIIDEVRIYNRALSAAEIAAMYNAQR